VDFNASPISRGRFHVIPNIVGKSIVGRCQKVPMEKLERKEGSECRLRVVERSRVRVTVTNKFKLSCSIDRSFERALSLPLSLGFPFRLLGFIEILCGIPMRSDSKVLSTRVAGPYITPDRREEGSLDSVRSLFHFSAFPKGATGCVSAGRKAVASLRVDKTTIIRPERLHV